MHFEAKYKTTYKLQYKLILYRGNLIITYSFYVLETMLIFITIHGSQNTKIKMLVLY
jgi:hypothetical protein